MKEQELKIEHEDQVRIYGPGFEVCICGNGFVSEFLTDEDGEERSHHFDSWIVDCRARQACRQ